MRGFSLYNLYSLIVTKIISSIQGFLHLALLFVLLSCNSGMDYSESHLTQEITETNKPQPEFLFPQELIISSNTHDLLSNTTIFKSPIVKKGTSTQPMDVDSLPKKFDQINYLFEPNIKQSIKPSSSENGFSISISFECERCQSAFLILSHPNDYDLPKEIQSGNLWTLNERLHKIDINEKAQYSHNLHVKELGSGWGSIYLILKDSSKNSSIFEVASIVTDKSPPVFISSSIGLYYKFQGDPTFEGQVCLETKEFTGNDYDGYDVPFKGEIYGDIKTLKISGRTMQIKGTDFYQRVHLQLKTGYNQIPITVIDNMGNKTESYMEVTLEYINSGPYIENNIYN